MKGGIRLHPCDRPTPLWEGRRGTDPDRRLRAHVLLLLDDGPPWALIAAVLFTSSSTINRWRRYLGGGLDAVLARPPRGRLSWWPALVVRMVLTLTPGDFGFVRSRWTCEAVAVVLGGQYRRGGSRETVRRGAGPPGPGVPPPPPPP